MALAQTINNVTITGRAVEIEVNEGGDASKPYIYGHIVIDTNYSPEAVQAADYAENGVRVSFFSSKFKKNGEENRLYPQLAAMKSEIKTVRTHQDEADIVRCSGAQIQENVYFTDSGERRDTFNVRGNFFNVANDRKSENNFEVEGIIVGVEPDLDADGLPTGKTYVKLATVDFRNQLDVLKYTATAPEAVEYINQSFTPGDAVKLTGSIVNETEVRREIETTAFGGDIVKETRNTVVALLINAATVPAPSPFADEDINRGMAEREGRIQETKEKALQKKQATKAVNAGAGLKAKEWTI